MSKLRTLESYQPSPLVSTDGEGCRRSETKAGHVRSGSLRLRLGKPLSAAGCGSLRIFSDTEGAGALPAVAAILIYDFRFTIDESCPD
jgi:hypothetical protein